MNTLLEITKKFPQTEIWNDSCSCSDLDYAIKNGACGATTNPVIVLNVLKKELGDWIPTIKNVIKEGPNLTEDEVAWKVIKALGKKASNLLYPTFIESKGKRGRISFQTNAKYYKNAEKMIEHACDLASTVPNSQIKAPTSKAGIEIFEELTYRGININATVSFTCSQAIAVAEAVERGLKRRENEGLPIDNMNPVCTLMVGRLDDYLKKYVAETNIEIDKNLLELAGVSVCKHTYSLYKERGYRTKLLVAAFRNNYHLTEFIGGDLVLTITHDYQKKYNDLEICIGSSIDNPVSNDVLKELLKLDEFKKAYYEDGLSLDNFQHYGAFLLTMNQFLNGYDDLIKLIRKYMLN